MKRKETFLIRWVAIAIGLVYLWFGALKFFPSLSPAEDLAVQTVNIITFGLLKGRSALLFLAVWELLIGVTFTIGYLRKWNTALAILHILCTFLPFILLSHLCFSEAVFQFTLTGQYIFKNILFLVVMIYLFRQQQELTVKP